MSKEVVHQLKCDRCKGVVRLQNEFGGMPEGWIKFTLQDLDDPYWYHLCGGCTHSHNMFMEGEAVEAVENPLQSFGFGTVV